MTASVLILAAWLLLGIAAAEAVAWAERASAREVDRHVAEALALANAEPGVIAEPERITRGEQHE